MMSAEMTSTTGMANLNIAQHPLLAHKMTVLRDRNTNATDFRKVCDTKQQTHKCSFLKYRK